MMLQEPKVEFVPIDSNVFTQSASGCPDWETQTPAGGGQRCVGTQPEAKPCANFDVSIPW